MKSDNRPRFGWASQKGMDSDPQIIWERSRGYLKDKRLPVVVIPLPFMSAKIRAKVRKLTKEYLWP